MNRIDRLAELFARFPGIGPRGAKRFVYFLLRQPKGFHMELANLLRDLGNDTSVCNKCQRFFTARQSETECSICSNKNRTTTSLMVVEKDVDLDNVERSGVYDGLYFVLGGTVPILEKEPNKKVKSDELLTYVTNNDFDEIILAMSANPDGDNTGDYIKGVLSPIAETKQSKITMLGRGLSTGSELEYSDRETIKNAFNNRN